MAYATRAQIEARYGLDELIQTTDRDGVGVETDAAITNALDDASAEADSYIGSRYDIPVTTSPRLVQVTCAIARYRLHEDHATDQIRRDYEDAVKWLRDIGAGRAVLPGASSGVVTATNVKVLASDRVFTDTLLATMP